MSNYLSLTSQEKEEMLAVIGVKSVDELFGDIAKGLRAKKLNLPAGKSQQETFEYMKALADMNTVYKTIFLGAGSYNHFIPSAVKSLSERSEFVTAYTPYQAEMSQGILQAIFEYQTMICKLTAMDVSNASHYSGATAAAEAAIMVCDKNKKLLVFDNINPDTATVLETYLAPRKIELIKLQSKDGCAVLQAIEAQSDFGGVYIETPNYFGLLEDGSAIAKTAHEKGAKLIVGSNPISLGLLVAPGEYGADVAVGEAQPLGMPMNFGGPYLGYMATTKELMRKIPGRIVGETTDADGNRAFVLTLQAREQHIRREKATSNICSNEAHCALIASIYLAAVGAEGLKEVALASASNAHYMAAELEKAGAKLRYGGEFFHEFVTVTSNKAKTILKALDDEGILGGLALSKDEILWCCTEMNTKDEIDKAVAIVGGAL